MNVKVLFLKDGLTKDVYVCQPQGFVISNPEQNVLRL
jgi:hypothetical protein